MFQPGILTADALNSALGLKADKKADESISNSATLQPDDALFVNALASTTYAFSALVLATADAAADWKMDLTVPAGTTWHLISQQFSRAAALGSQLIDTRTATTGGNFALAMAGTTFSTQAQWIFFNGVLITGGTAGEVRIRWAQNAAHASAATVYAGSWLRLS